MKYKVGELVKYYKLYGDIYIVRDTGYGVITEFNEYVYGDEISKIYTLLISGKISHFEEHQIEKIEV
jgi:hypothetical protein